MSRSFYLGTRAGSVERMEVPADRFTTHAVAIGMTGSGKTGLLVDLLEEAALAGIPCLVLDPKGDLTNRLLVFPDLRPEDFAPFTGEERAAETAERWRKGVESAGFGREDLLRLAGHPVSVFTPGAEPRPLNLLERFTPPPTEDERPDGALAAAASLFSLLDLDADPATAPEGLLLCHLLLDLWARGKVPTLEDLVRGVLQPPVQRIGVLELDAVLPPRDRTALASRLNALLASPALRSWRTGPSLDLDGWLGPGAGGRQTLFVLNHLSERERLFFLGILLGEVAAWTRRQAGSDALRALLVFDEVFGYFPPHPRNPPTKAPLLSLLKQARAFGVGVVLATQNPVDLDYKGLTNAGLWFLGRLQTEPDVRRVAEALGTLPGGEKAAARLSAVAPRTFLLHDVKQDAPVLLQTRHCLSFLAGPLSPAQLEPLLKRGPTPEPPAASGGEAVPQATVPAGWTARYLGTGPLEPYLEVAARLVYRVSPKAPPAAVSVEAAWRLSGETLEEDLARTPVEAPEEGSPAPSEGSRPAPLPAYFARLSPEKASKACAEALALHRPLVLRRDPETGLLEEPGEGEGAFLRRVLSAREERASARREKALAPLLKERARLEDRLSELQRKADSQRAEAKARDAETALSAGLGVLGGLFGSKRSLGSAIRTTVSKKRMADRAEDRLRFLEAEIEEARDRLRQIEEEVDRARRDLSAGLPPAFERVTVAAARGSVTILRLSLLWRPREAALSP